MKAAEARTLIGKRVAWDEISPRYHFERSGILEEVDGRNVKIDGDYKWLPYLTNFREAA